MTMDSTAGHQARPDARDVRADAHSLSSRSRAASIPPSCSRSPTTCSAIRVLALTTTSPTMPDEDRDSALEMAALIGARHLVVESNELEIPGYARIRSIDATCASTTCSPLRGQGGELGIDEIVDGLNLDDLHDYRPGMKAASEKRVRHPLVEAEMTKAEIRELSRAMGLPTWDRPASPCLSSRFPYGTEITPEGLRKVAAGENLLHSLGFRVARVRYHGEVARLEVEQTEIARSSSRDSRDVDREFKKSAFASSRSIWAAFAPARSTKASSRKRQRRWVPLARHAIKPELYGRRRNRRFVAAQ